MNENSFNPRILCPTKLSFKVGGVIKDFHNKQKLKQHMTPSHHYKRISKEFCTEKMKANKTMKGQAAGNQGGKKTRNQRKTLMQLYTIKLLNNKNN
jgi:hypothetical protein